MTDKYGPLFTVRNFQSYSTRLRSNGLATDDKSFNSKETVIRPVAVPFRRPRTTPPRILPAPMPSVTRSIYQALLPGIVTLIGGLIGVGIGVGIFTERIDLAGLLGLDLATTAEATNNVTFAANITYAGDSINFNVTDTDEIENSNAQNQNANAANDVTNTDVNNVDTNVVETNVNTNGKVP